MRRGRATTYQGRVKPCCVSNADFVAPFDQLLTIITIQFDNGAPRGLSATTSVGPATLQHFEQRTFGSADTRGRAALFS